MKVLDDSYWAVGPRQRLKRLKFLIDENAQAKKS